MTDPTPEDVEQLERDIKEEARIRLLNDRFQRALRSGHSPFHFNPVKYDLTVVHRKEKP